MRVSRVYLKDYYPFLGEDGKNPTVDAYLPYNLAEMGREHEKRPTMVVCPGGGYWICSEREAEPIALKFLDMGFNVFVLYYSTAPHRFPSAINEVAALFDYINKNADELNCDVEKIGIIGFSAGGHLAAHYSNLCDDDVIKEHFENTYRPAVSVLCYPVISTDNSHRGSFENLLGHFPENEEEINRFSCEKLVNENTPPTFIFHTAVDTTVPVSNSLCYAKALAENKISFELHIYPCGSHGLATADILTLNNVNEEIIHTGAWINDLKKWLGFMLNHKTN